MRLVKEILNNKGREFWSVASQSTAYDAIKLMADKGIGSVLVIDNGEIRGIVSERDFVRKIGLDPQVSPDVPVAQIMTTQVLCTRPDQPIDECMALMTDKRVRHLPVMEAGNIVGVVSIGDLVKAVISEQQFVIKQLESYIAG